jgi:pyruvate formate-lyase activating enzyme-like uncharacterized protein
MKIARLITTMACNRSCDYCCNKYDSLIGKAIDITTLDPILDSDVVCLTGGEPMLYPDKLERIIYSLKGGTMMMGQPNLKIYLYSASYWSPDFQKSLRDFIPLVDGIHFTLHAKTTSQDIEGFTSLQAAIEEHRKYGTGDKSFRAYIAPDIKNYIPVVPYLWSRLEIKPWIPEGKCPLPPNETLYRLVTA